VSTITVMSDWNLDPAAADAEFKFVPPEGATDIPFIPAEGTTAFGR
jgi:outer membrane lipoprotein-sorting protein